MEPILIFFIASAIINIVRILTEIAFINPSIIRAYNRRMSELRARMKKAMKTRDPRLMAKVKKEQQALNSMTAVVTKMRMKSFLINIPVSILIFVYLVLPIIHEAFYVPLIGYISGLIYLFLVSFAVSGGANIILKALGYS